VIILLYESGERAVINIKRVKGRREPNRRMFIRRFVANEPGLCMTAVTMTMGLQRCGLNGWRRTLCPSSGRFTPDTGDKTIRHSDDVCVHLYHHVIARARQCRSVWH